MACDMLGYMGDRLHAHVGLFDMDVEYTRLAEDVATCLDSSALCIKDENGMEIKRNPDPELSGELADEGENTKRYSIAYTEDDVMRFTPETRDFDKAVCMHDILQNDMNFNMDLVVDMENGKKDFILFDETYVTDEEGQYYETADKSFEEGIASLSQNEGNMSL